jgi:hypothetical protein
MTLSVGRRVQHSESLRALMRDTLGAPHLDDIMREAAAQAMTRCLALDGCFATRSDAVAWAHTLAGQVAIAALMLATIEAAERESPSAARAAAREWATARLEAARHAALTGAPVERRLGDAKRVADMIAGYAGDIGDLEQAPPGVEEGLDPLLQRAPGAGGYPGFDHLPGNAQGKTEPMPDAAPSVDAKRALAAALLKKRIASKVS